MALAAFWNSAKIVIGCEDYLFGCVVRIVYFVSNNAKHTEPGKITLGTQIVLSLLLTQ